MVRGQILATRDSGYVEAARRSGTPDGAIVRAHIFPNAMRPLVASSRSASASRSSGPRGSPSSASASPPPSPEWGALLNAGPHLHHQAWWLDVMPGLVIVLFALVATTLGRHVQQRLEGGVNR